MIICLLEFYTLCRASGFVLVKWFFSLEISHFDFPGSNGSRLEASGVPGTQLIISHYKALRCASVRLLGFTLLLSLHRRHAQPTSRGTWFRHPKTAYLLQFPVGSCAVSAQSSIAALDSGRTARPWHFKGIPHYAMDTVYVLIYFEYLVAGAHDQTRVTRGNFIDAEMFISWWTTDRVAWNVRKTWEIGNSSEIFHEISRSCKCFRFFRATVYNPRSNTRK